MSRSKVSFVISILSLAVATGSVAALFSIRHATSSGSSRLKATSYQDDPSAEQTALPIDPEAVDYQQTRQFPVDMKRVTALAVDAEDHIYVGGDKCFCRYSPSGQLEDRITLSFEPTCLTITGRAHIVADRIYVGFADHVEVFGADGKEAIWQGVDKARFTSISTVDHDVFIADNGWNVIQHFDITGKLLSAIGEDSRGHFAPAPGGNAEYFDLVGGMDDLVYVVNRRECRIEGYTVSGEQERHWGLASPAIEDFSGRNNPTQIALTSDGQFVTAEENPRRVKVYQRSGDFAGIVCGPEATGPVADLAADHHHRILVLDAAARCVRIFEAKKATAKAEKRE